MATNTEQRRPVHRAPNTKWVTPTVIVFVTVIVVLACFVIRDTIRDGKSPRELKSSGTVSGLSPIPTPTATTTNPSPVAKPEDLVANALALKPLEDIQKGDRVIYQGHVCRWILWDKDINTSTIKCPGQKQFEIQTGRLTPVEKKTGKSKLKVRH